MSLQLTVPVEFLRAPEFPTCCFYTGRTDQVRVKTIKLVAEPQNANPQSIRVPLPQAVLPFWVRVQKLQLFKLPGLAVFFFFFWTYFIQQRRFPFGTAAVIVIGAMAASLVTEWLVNIYCRHICAGIEGGQTLDTVILKFPLRQTHRYHQYSQAYDVWRERQRVENPGALLLTGTVDWTAHPETRWQSPDEPPPVAPAEMDRRGLYVLEVPIVFLNSRFLPHRCIYTGKVTAVRRVLEYIDFRRTFQLQPAPKSVAIPQVSGGRFAWQFYELFPWMILGGVPILPIVVLKALLPERLWWVGVLVFLLALPVAIAVFFRARHWIGHFRVTLNPIPDTDCLRLGFPARHRDTYLVFRQAWGDYQDALKHGRLQDPATDGDLIQLDSTLDEDPEAWVDPGGAAAADAVRWDETKR